MLWDLLIDRFPPSLPSVIRAVQRHHILIRKKLLKNKQIKLNCYILGLGKKSKFGQADSGILRELEVDLVVVSIFTFSLWKQIIYPNFSYVCLHRLITIIYYSWLCIFVIMTICKEDIYMRRNVILHIKPVTSQDLAKNTQQPMESSCSLRECLSGDYPGGKAWVSIAHSLALSGSKPWNVCIV